MITDALVRSIAVIVGTMLSTTSAAEVVIIPDVIIRGDDVTDFLSPPTVNLPVAEIASSTRIAIRAASSTTDATDRLFDAVIIGGVVAAGGGGESSHVF